MKAFILCIGIVNCTRLSMRHSKSSHRILMDSLTTTTKSDEFEVLSIYERTDRQFIQGLYWDLGKKALLQSSGWVGKSRTQWLEINEQKALVSPTVNVAMNPSKVFGEGISPLNDHQFIEMTWKDGYLYVVDRETLQNVKVFDNMKEMWPSVKEGWGIT